jgi:two-component sensor histidine kinase
MFYQGGQPRLPDMLKQFGVALSYALLIYIGELYFDSESLVGHFEPACGLALAALLIGGRRYVWGVFLGAIAVHAMTDSLLWRAVIVASGDTLGAFLGAWLLARDGRFDTRLESLLDYLRLILLGGGVSISVSALAVNTALLSFGLLAPENYLHGMAKWWMSDTLGVILVAPLILIWWRTEYDWREPKRIAEAVMLLGLTMLVGQMIFLDWLHGVIGHATEGYWMFMLITWVAMFLGTRGVTLALIVVAVQALSGAIMEVGYFADDIARTNLVNYWFYMLTLSLVGMSLATYVHEIRQTKQVAAQRGVLIREIHHRIKNNLQGVTGLLRQFAHSHPEIAEPVNEAIGQVQSIAAIHGLQERAPAGNVRLREMAEAVAAGVGALWQRHVDVEISPGWRPCAIEEAEAVPLALILNELLSNAIKHGSGQTRIVLGQGRRSGSIQLGISNAGQLPPGFDPGRTTGTGLQLIESLLPRAGAKLSWENGDNTVVTVLELEPPVVNLESES